MEKGDLIQQDFKKIIYKNDTIVYSQVPYDERPYELEAFAMENNIEKKLRELLYK